MWNGPEGKRFFQSIFRLGTVRSYVARHAMILPASAGQWFSECVKQRLQVPSP